MKMLTKILLFLALPMIAPLLFPPANLRTDQAIIPLGIFFGSIIAGVLLFRGRSNALTLAIFLQGLNVIIRLMMLFPNAFSVSLGRIDYLFLITSVASISLSMYLLLRLDKADIRVQMVT